MNTQYRIVISNKNLYKEVLLPGNMTQLRVGTNTECDFRLRPDLFFSPISLDFVNVDGNWSVMCSDEIYISEGDIRKLITKPLKHGDEFFIKYQNTDAEVFQVSFAIDFDSIDKKYDCCVDILGKSSIKIGGGRSTDIMLNSEYINNDFFEIRKQGNSYILVKDNTTYGVYLNGIRNKQDVELKKNDFISFAEFSFCFYNQMLYTTSSSKMNVNLLNMNMVADTKSQHQYPKFNRSSRIHKQLNTEKIPILDPTNPPTKPKSNIVMQLLPAIAMLAVTVILRGFVMNSGGSMASYVWISAISMSIGIITSVFGIIDERKKYKKDVQERDEVYRNYIASKEAQIKQLREAELSVLEDTYYSSQKEIAFIDSFDGKLFDREIDDEDFLTVRLGTGDVKSVREIDYKKSEKLQIGDELSEMPAKLAEKYKFVQESPVVVSLLKQSEVGFVGTRDELYAQLKNITLDLVTRQYYTELQLFYILNENDEKQFSWLRFLPHLQNDSLQMRNIVYDDTSKSYLFEYLYKELTKRETSKMMLPHIVVFVYKDMGLKRHPISRYLNQASQLGIHFIFFEEYPELLPNGCSTVITLEGTDGQVIDTKGEVEPKDFHYLTIDDNQMQKIVNKLAPVYCEEVSLEGALTKSITLFEMMNIFSVDDIDLEKNWESAEVYKSMAAPLGVKTKSQIVYLDLNEKYHGPHGLVAGTTGSGKSEILQTYILSMAAKFHPYEVGFVIIDFKGGGMVNQFKDLPHLIGAITNIDGREINRSLLSIKAELRKRQALFAQHNVNHVDQYIKLYKKGEAQIPLPHLILIVDEFAELKMDQPEFMKELISAARIGRSLGVHLILATQKPSGVVDAQIWSNSKFKLCLKVQNKEDSNEVLKTPLAAEIKEPGRAYLQVGNNEIFELFQSAYSGASVDTNDNIVSSAFAIDELDLAGRRTNVFTHKIEKSDDESETQLMAMVKYIAAYCDKKQIAKLPGICLPPLEERIDYVESTAEKDVINSIVPIGIYDDPDSQIQDVVNMNLLEGNLIVIGSSQFGKTNLLQVLLRGLVNQYSPRETNIYILDFGSMALKIYENLNHIGGVVLASDDEKMKNFMRLIMQEMNKRKEIFSTMGITSFASYREAGKTDIPHIIIMVDNFIGLKEFYPDYEDEILTICRDGLSVGISIVITSLQTAGISYRYMSNFANRICLYCNLNDEYSTIFDRCRMEPKNVAGRGLVEIDKNIFEYQTYLAFEGEKEIDRVKTIKAFIDEANQKYAGMKAKRIPEVPEVLDIAVAKEQYEYNSQRLFQVPLGVDYDTVDYVDIDLERTMTIAITGREQSGRTNFVKLILQHMQEQIFDASSQVYVLDDFQKQLDAVSAMGITEKYTLDTNDFEFILTEIEEEMQSRLELVQMQGIAALKDLPQIVVVVQNNNIFAPDAISKSVVETFKRILKTYRNMKLTFIFSNVDNVAIAYGSTEMLKLVKEFNYLFVFEDLANLKLADINATILRKYKKPIDLGDCYVVTEKGVSKMKSIHLRKE